MSPLARVLHLPLLASMFLLGACFKPAETPPPVVEAPAPAEPFAAPPSAPSQPTTVGGIPAASIAAAQRAVAKVEAASTATLDNGALYKQAQALFTEKKYSEALTALDSIQAELMTAPQTKAVNDLRTKITEAQRLGQ